MYEKNSSDFKIAFSRFSAEEYLIEYNHPNTLIVSKGIFGLANPSDAEYMKAKKQKEINLGFKEVDTIYSKLSLIKSFEEKNITYTDSWIVRLSVDNEVYSFIYGNAKDNNLNYFIDYMISLSPIEIIGNDGQKIQNSL